MNSQQVIFLAIAFFVFLIWIVCKDKSGSRSASQMEMEAFVEYASIKALKYDISRTEMTVTIYTKDRIQSRRDINFFLKGMSANGEFTGEIKYLIVVEDE